MAVVWAEDEEADRYMIRLALEQTSAPPVRFVSDGVDALHAIQARRPRLVVLDMNMPILNGLEALRRLRKDAATQDLPVVVFSTAGSRDEEEACRKLGAAYVQKPTAPEAFSAAVARIVAAA